MRFAKRALAVLLGALSVASLAACGPKGPVGGGNSNDRTPDNVEDMTVIKVQNFTGGIGIQWLYNAADRFQAANVNTSFEDGKTGIYVDVSPTQPDSTNLSSSGYHIVFDERYSNIYSLAQKGDILDISDLLTEEDANGKSLESRIDDKNLESLKGADGKYYALPHYEWFPGLIYDKEAFDAEGWYLAKDATNGKKYDCKYGTQYFVRNSSSQKSCGPDGVYGTEDDGLPSSLQEMLVVCAYIARGDMKPFTLTGGYDYYANYLVEGLWASLAGYDELSAIYNLSGEVEVVTGYLDEPLFQGIDYIKKPTTETVTITDKTGYLAFESAARYYATAFVEVIYKEGWFTAEATDPNVSHLGAQEKFINGGMDSTTPARAFLIEGSYWYNEAVEAKAFDDYFIMTEKTTRDVRFMSLPTSVSASVEPKAEGEAPNKVTLLDNGIAYAYINARFKDDEDIVKACKDFLRFVYSDAELREFTAMTGITRPIAYELSSGEMARLSSYQKSVYAMSQASDTLYFGSQNEVFKRNQAALKLHFSAQILRPVFDNTTYSGYFSAILAGKTAEDIFEETAFGKNVWSGIVPNA